MRHTQRQRIKNHNKNKNKAWQWGISNKKQPQVSQKVEVRGDGWRVWQKSQAFKQVQRAIQIWKCISVWVARAMGSYPHTRQRLYTTWVCDIDGKSGSTHEQAMNLCWLELTHKSAADSSKASTSRGNWAGIGDGADTVPIYVGVVVVVLA